MDKNSNDKNAKNKIYQKKIYLEKLKILRNKKNKQVYRKWNWKSKEENSTKPGIISKNAKIDWIYFLGFLI